MWKRNQKVKNDVAQKGKYQPFPKGRGRRNWAEKKKYQESRMPKRQCPHFCLKYKKNDLWNTVLYKNFQ